MMGAISEWTIRREALNQAIRFTVERGGDVLDRARKFRDFLADEEVDEEDGEHAPIGITVNVNVDGELPVL